MSQHIHLELSESAFAAIQQQADAIGTSPASFVETLLENQYRNQPLTEQEAMSARLRFESHFGEVSLGYATGSENSGIDADLAKAYAAQNEIS